jgi:hypothetical protein
MTYHNKEDPSAFPPLPNEVPPYEMQAIGHSPPQWHQQQQQQQQQ